MARRAVGAWRAALLALGEGEPRLWRLAKVVGRGRVVGLGLLLAVSGCGPRMHAVVTPLPPRLAAGSVVDADSARRAAAAADRDATTLRPARASDVGMRQQALDSLDDMVMQALRAGAAPGAAIAIGRHGRIVKMGGYGLLDLRPGFNAVDDSTVYDIASLTKVVATTTAVMMLVDAGKLRLDTPLGQILPEWSGSPERDAITVRNLLLHNSGLSAGGELYNSIRGREAYRATIASKPLAYPIGTRTVYSDYGAILLGFVVEEISGMPLDEFVGSRLFAPLGMRDTGFNPLEAPGGVRSTLFDIGNGPRTRVTPKDRIAPTEYSAVLGGGRPLQGIVHDENAYALGGVAGHAGLFSSARDLAVFSQMMLNRGYYAGHRYIDSTTVDAFTTRYSTASSRAYGWDTPAPNASSGEYFTASSYGHTGYTGTSIWIDPERDVFVVLLTNRVNPTSANQKHLALRIMVADQVQKAIDDMPVEKRPGPGARRPD